MTLTISEFFFVSSKWEFFPSAPNSGSLHALSTLWEILAFFISIHIALQPAARKTLCAHTLKFELFKRLNHCYED